MIRFIVWLIACFISTFGYTYLFYKINGCKNISKKFIFIFIVGVITITLFKFFDIKYYTLLSYFIFYPTLFYSVSKISCKKILINTLIIGLLGLALDLISMIFASSICYILKVDLNSYYNVLSISLSIAVVFAFICLGNCKKSNKILIKIINFFNDIEYLDYVLIIFCIFISILGIGLSFNLKSIHVGMLLFTIILLSLFVFILLIKFKINDIESRKYLETLKQNNDFYIKMENENRIFKHNLKAKLASIKSVSNKKAIALIDDYVIKISKSVSYSKKIKQVPYGLNGIIYEKTYPYLENINFKITNKIDFDIFKVLKPRRYNVLVEKLIVSLDNAIEASLNSKNKVIVINLYNDSDNIYIEIKNSFSHDLDLDSLGNVNYSTKGNKRGLGLFSILRDKEVSLHIKVVNNYFITLITAKKQK